MEKIRFTRIDPNKGMVAFTWDDNSASHYSIMAPLFGEYGYRCTYYINPGEANFDDLHEKEYILLSGQGFEIGSHGYTHHHFSALPQQDFFRQLIDAKAAIQSMLNRHPTTFAFPHHDFNRVMLSEAKEHYFETRNTLNNARRFSLKTATTIESVNEEINNAIRDSYTLVFSGHGMIDPRSSVDRNGYEPISAKTLSDILDIISRHKSLQTVTFEQAALLTFVRMYCNLVGNTAWIEEVHLQHLKRYGFSIERIADLL